MDVSCSRPPAYWSVLDNCDQHTYLALRRQFGLLTARTSRSRLAATYRFIIQQLDAFVNQKDGDDWKRSLVCGIVWLEGAIAVSTRQLSLLIGRSKSSINAGLQTLGTIPASIDGIGPLLRTCPVFLGACADIRQWTIRMIISPQAAKNPAVSSCCGFWNQNVLDDLEDFRIKDDSLEDE
jgi:hypothetical protein